LRRYFDGYASRLDATNALRSLSAVQNPRIRTSCVNAHSYVLSLRAQYGEALQLARLMLDDASKYQLSWAIPHAEWLVAFASLGTRDFAQADRSLRRVERAAEELDDVHLRLNAAALRARFLVALQRPAEARNALAVDDRAPVGPAMRGEFIATRAIVAAILGH